MITSPVLQAPGDLLPIPRIASFFSSLGYSEGYETGCEAGRCEVIQWLYDSLLLTKTQAEKMLDDFGCDGYLLSERDEEKS